ncbi:helix-turn-helix domain-containing protein [Kibdelosporangium lantanae]|uniref:Helix-turn-helix domain-containing protein n=1 Tax=Kibdelosporangium lantanae TaxID=1497396 RepID=A0ABW3MJC9_9PSEU
MFRHLGRLEVAEGRSVDTLQSAYRIGARVAWRRIAEFGQAVNLPVVTICQLAEAAAMTQPAVARFEAGGTVPTIPLLERLAHALEAELVVRLSPRVSAA